MYTMQMADKLESKNENKKRFVTQGVKNNQVLRMAPGDSICTACEG